MALPVVPGINAAALDTKLAAIFANGTAAVGLEVGADAGLAASEYVALPLSMRKNWAARTHGHATAFDGNYANPLPANWATGGSIRIVGGQAFTVRAGTVTRVDAVHVEPITFEDVCNFVNVNRGRIREGDYDVKHEWWVHAVRFWSAASGLIKQDHSVEWLLVPNPANGTITAADVTDAARILEYGPNALTAAAARASSWRKTNHATGGNTAGGFPRRWMQKEGYWPSTGDVTTRKAEEVKITTAFYMATHAVSVHAALALMAPTDPGHWALIDPSYGFTLTWDVKESVRIRIAPMTQVAGASIVVDSCVVAESLVKDALWPMVRNQGQLMALVGARTEVSNHGVAVAVYSSWFLNNHPLAVAPRAFNQKDSTFFALASELAIIAVTYYKGTTIADSPSLRNAAGQSADDNIRTQWGAIAREKTRATPTQALTAYARLSGALGQGYLVQLASDADGDITSGVGGAQGTLDQAAAALGLAAAPTLNTADIVARKDATKAAAAALIAAPTI